MRSRRRCFAAMERGARSWCEGHPYLDAGVRLGVADAGSITRKVKGSLRKSTLALGQSCNATGLLHRGGALNEPGTRVESHPICLWAEGSHSIRRPVSVVQGSSHYTLLCLPRRMGSMSLLRRGNHSTDAVPRSRQPGGREVASCVRGTRSDAALLLSRPHTRAHGLFGD